MVSISALHPIFTPSAQVSNFSFFRFKYHPALAFNICLCIIMKKLNHFHIYPSDLYFKILPNSIYICPSFSFSVIEVKSVTASNSFMHVSIYNSPGLSLSPSKSGSIHAEYFTLDPDPNSFFDSSLFYRPLPFLFDIFVNESKTTKLYNAVNSQVFQCKFTGFGMHDSEM